MTAPSAAVRIALVVATASLVASVVPSTVTAKGRPGDGTSSLALVLLNSTDGLPHWGQQVTFSVSTTATDKPMVSLKCYQGAALVYAFQAGFYPDYPWTKLATLRSNSWTGGAADCDARLYKAAGGTKTTTLATLRFHVYA